LLLFFLKEQLVSHKFILQHIKEMASISPQNAVRGIACGLIAFSFMLLGFCANASGMVNQNYRQILYHLPVQPIRLFICLCLWHISE
jgi:hypothetical protein